MKNDLKIYYDEEGDLLEIIIGKPVSSYYVEINEGIFERRDKKSQKISGFSIFNFRRRARDKNGVIIPLPISKYVN